MNNNTFMVVTSLLSGLGATIQASAEDAVFQSVGLEEVVVTAERRESTAQKSAIAITAETGAELEARSKVSLDDVILSMPNVAIQQTAGGAGVFIRGIGSNDTGFGDPSINFNIDGVYQQDPGIISVGTFDVARVEVLRGPQGTLYGRNSTAGSLNLITNDPQLDGLAGSLRLNAANYRGFRGDGMVNVPLSDSVALRLAGFSNNSDGYAKPTGQNDVDQSGGRLKALFAPGDNLRLIVSGAYLREKNRGGANFALPAVGTDRNSLADPWYDATLIVGDINHKFTNVNAQLDWKTSGIALTVIPSYVRSQRDDTNNNIHQVEETTQKALEARAASDNAGAVTWLLGAIYLDGVYTRVTPGAVGTTTYADSQRQPLTSVGIFGQSTWSVSSAFRLTGGLRYSSDRKSKSDIWTNTVAPFDTAVSPVTPKTFSSVDYKVGAELDLSPTSLLYATVSSGYKSGGFQTFGNVGGASATFDPEKLRAYEIGSKNRFLDNRLQANLTAYYYDYKDYQVKYPVIQPGLFSVQTVNAGAARIYGAELETVFRVTPKDRLDAYVTLTDSQFKSFSYTAIYPFGPRTFDYTGKSLPNAPKFTARAAYEHEFDFAGTSSLTPRVESGYSSGYYVTHERQAAVPPPLLPIFPSGFMPIGTYQYSYHRTDVSIRYEHSGMRLAVIGYMKNIEGAAVASGGGQNGVTLQAPRTYGVTLEKKF